VFLAPGTRVAVEALAAPGSGRVVAPCGKGTRVVSPYLKQPERSQADALRTMIAERERELSRTTDPCLQDRLRREIVALKAQRHCAGDAASPAAVAHEYSRLRECLWCSRDIAMPCSGLSDPDLAALTEVDEPICRDQIDRHKPTTRLYKSIV
jgi:hypothetical protein